MASQVRYGKVQVAECPCCANPPVDFHSEEGRERRRRFVRHYKTESTAQLSLATLALVSGGISAILAFHNPTFPYFLCLPLVSGVLMLIAGACGLKAGRANVDDEVPAAVKRFVIVHYVFSVTGCTFSMLATGFSGVGLGYCLSPADSTFRADCQPYRDARIAFLAIDIVLAFLLFITCIVGCVLFCMHARTLGFSNRLQRMENELNMLRAQVATLTQAQQAQQSGGESVGEVRPPPAYSEISQGGLSYGGFSNEGQGGIQYGGDFGMGGGKRLWPAGY